ncbi:glycine cleavage system aminomethyltransferase GcvT [Rugosimonospora acidiphila]|uniref:Aminomethyltransferase n=1 Tax=Rugosimonospora acidiphila TaxID=556531 RepID=A0ABP9SQY0_9ACTN
MVVPNVRETPLASEHARLGATFTTFAGWRMPLRYVSDLREHEAVRTAAGLFDLSHMGQIEITGPDAARFLDHALVLDASAMPVDRARYTLICTASGGMLDDLVVYHTGEDQFLIVANAANVATVSAELDARIAGFDARTRDVSDRYALISLQGPRAAEILAEHTPADLNGLRYYSAVASRVAGREALLARTGYTGELGFEIYVAPDDATAVWADLLRSGESAGVQPVGLAARDTLRLEAGMPLYGNELTVDVTPLHAGLGWAVPADKAADYVGRKALEEYRQSGTPSVLVGLEGTGRRAARAGNPVVDPESGAAVGRVTSGVLSPTLGHPIAMAYVPPALAEPGTPVDVDVRGSMLRMTVVAKPFYRRADARRQIAPA